MTDPNIVYELEMKFEGNGIFGKQDIENFAEAFFNPKVNQAKMTSAIKPAVDKYKVGYKKVLEEIGKYDELLERENDETLIHNYGLSLREANEKKSELDIFKKDLVTFVRLYEFLSQIVDYGDEELEKLWAFVKHLIPNLKTYETKEPIDISMVELTHYRLHQQKANSIVLLGEDAELKPISSGGAVARDPKKELLSYVVDEMNHLFSGEFSSSDMINYARTLKDKMAENKTVMEQVQKNSQEQAMMGGFVETMTDAVIENMEHHQDVASQILSQEQIAKGLASILYKMLKAEKSQNYVINSDYGLDRVAEKGSIYTKT